MKPSKRNDSSLFRNAYNLPYDEMMRLKLYRTCKGNLDLIQRMGLLKRMAVHSGCVNTICWNESGEHLLSGSDDEHLIITNGFTYKVVEDFKTTHKANIFSAKFLPCTRDSRIVSCSGDGMILFTDLMCRDDPVYKPFNCHCGTAYELATIPLDPNSFLSCGEDGTVRWFDLRIKDHCNRSNCHEDVMISCQRAVTALSVNATAPYQLAIGCSDSTVRLFDRRMLGTRASGMIHKSVQPLSIFTVPSFKRPYRISSLCFSPDGEEILVSYSSNDLYLFGIKDYGNTHLHTDLPSSKKCKSLYRVKDSSPTPVRRLRLRGDWSDTGPDARPERESSRRGEIAQARPTLHTPLMQHLTNVISRLLNDPATRAALNVRGEDSLNNVDEPQPHAANVGPTTSSASVDSQENSSTPFSGAEVAYDSDMMSASPAVGSESHVETFEAQSVETPLSTSNPVQKVAIINDSLELSSHASMDSAGKTASQIKVAMDLPDPKAEGVPSCSKEVNYTSTNDVSKCSENLHMNMSLSESKPVSTGSEIIEKSTPNSKCEHGSLPEEVRSEVPVSGIRRDTSEPQRLFAETGIHQSDLNTLQSHLVGVREGYIGRHGMEPDVRLSYSQISSSSSHISLRPEEALTHQSSVDPSTQSSLQERVHESSDRSSLQQSSLNEGEAGPSHNLMSDSVSEAGSTLSDDCDSIEEEFQGLRGKVKSLKNSLSRRSCESDEEEVTASPEIKQKYTGHRNARTMIKEATFWGSNYVMSGSDCGHIFIWERIGGRLVMLLEADAHVVNCLQPHPSQPLLATSGIDHDVKLWAPVGTEPSFDDKKADEIMKRNALMLEETKDTITVPASFMIRMVACLSQIRRGGRTRSGRRQHDSQED